MHGGEIRGARARPVGGQGACCLGRAVPCGGGSVARRRSLRTVAGSAARERGQCTVAGSAARERGQCTVAGAAARRRGQCAEARSVCWSEAGGASFGRWCGARALRHRDAVRYGGRAGARRPGQCAVAGSVARWRGRWAGKGRAALGARCRTAAGRWREGQASARRRESKASARRRSRCTGFGRWCGARARRRRCAVPFGGGAP